LIGREVFLAIDLAPLAKLTDLRVLQLNGSILIEDLRPLVNLPVLEELQKIMESGRPFQLYSSLHSTHYLLSASSADPSRLSG